MGYYFVYDSNIIHIAPSPTTQAEYTIKLSQSGLDIFSGVDQKIDGKVRVNKTKWYLLEFKWDATGKWSLADTKAGLFVNPPDGLQKIERLPPSQASIIICVWIVPDGSWTEQTNQLRAITSLWENIVRPGHIRESDALYYFPTTIKILVVPTCCHHYVSESMSLSEISRPLLLPTGLSNTQKTTKRHCDCYPISHWPQ